MKDASIISELRGWTAGPDASDDAIAKLWLMRRAADAIETARADRARLLSALRVIAEPISGTPCGDPWAFYADLQAFARAEIAAVDAKAEDELRSAEP